MKMREGGSEFLLRMAIPASTAASKATMIMGRIHLKSMLLVLLEELRSI